MVQETRHALQHLVISEGWIYLKTLLERQIEWRKRDALAIATGLDALIENQGLLREAAGIMLAVSLPQTLLDDVTEEMERLKSEIEEEKDEKAEE